MRITLNKNEVRALAETVEAITGERADHYENFSHKSKTVEVVNDERGMMITINRGFVVECLNLFKRKFAPVLRTCIEFVKSISADSEVKEFGKKWFEDSNTMTIILPLNEKPEILAVALSATNRIENDPVKSELRVKVGKETFSDIKYKLDEIGYNLNQKEYNVYELYHKPSVKRVNNNVSSESRIISTRNNVTPEVCRINMTNKSHIRNILNILTEKGIISCMNDDGQIIFFKTNKYKVLSTISHHGYYIIKAKDYMMDGISKSEAYYVNKRNDGNYIRVTLTCSASDITNYIIAGSTLDDINCLFQYDNTNSFSIIMEFKNIKRFLELVNYDIVCGISNY